MRCRRGCRPWAHQWFLRLDDWQVACTECDAVKRERRRRAAHKAGRVLIPTSSELDAIKETNMDKLLTYAKSVVAAVGVVVTLVQAAVADQAVSLAEAQGIWTAVLAAVTVVAVYAVPNKPAG